VLRLVTLPLSIAKPRFDTRSCRMSRSKIARRSFLQSAAATAVSTVWPAASSAQDGALEEKPLRVGIIGIGSRAREHIDCSVHHPRMELTGLCDIRPEALTTGVQRSGGRPATFADFRKMLADLPLDVVVIRS